jgi:hypothetical protein
MLSISLTDCSLMPSSAFTRNVSEPYKGVWAWQIRGTKRLLLYKPCDLHKLRPYPRWHILGRRCRVDPCQPDYSRFPAFSEVPFATNILPSGPSPKQKPRWRFGNLEDGTMLALLIFLWPVTGGSSGSGARARGHSVLSFAMGPLYGEPGPVNQYHIQIWAPAAGHCKAGTNHGTIQGMPRCCEGLVRASAGWSFDASCALTQRRTQCSRP